MNSSIPAQIAPYLLSVLRIVAALSFMMHGSQKLFGLPALQAREPVDWLSRAGLAGELELFGGLLLLLGWFTRPVAFLLSGEMAVAYGLSHASRSVWPVLNGGEPAVLFCFIWLYVAAAGAGPWSLDAMRRISRRT